VVLLHGRGASARDILGLAEPLSAGKKLAFLAPQAVGFSWYPLSFLAPREQNEPQLSAALHKVAAVIDQARAAGFAPHRILLGGFSQGACLATEFVATHPARWAGLLAFSGGLIGPPGSSLARPGDLAGTPAFLGGSDPDPHVPWSRMEESAAVLTAMGAQVELRRYPGEPHSVNGEELAIACRLVAQTFA
jgi:predicted esterase